MRKVIDFILKRKITIITCVLLMILGFGWLVWATTIGTDVDISGSLKMSGTEVISSAGKLLIGAMPTGGNWDITSDLTIEGPATPTFFVGRDGGTYAGRVGVGTATPAHNLDVDGDLRVTGNILIPEDCYWTADVCDDQLACDSSEFMAGVERRATDTETFPLCGEHPDYWYRMRIRCCKF